MSIAPVIGRAGSVGTRVASAAAAAPTAKPAGFTASMGSSGAGVEMYGFSSGTERRLSDEDIAHDPTAGAALANGRKVNEFFSSAFQRDGWDGKGSPLKLVVHAPDEDGAPHLNNAYWDLDRSKVYLGDGDGRISGPLGNALDVVTHEATHAIVDAETNLRYSGQQGGINESFADVLASVADPDDWQVGEDVFTPGRSGDAIRDLQRPRFEHTRQIPPGGDVDVYDLSGIPSLAAVKVAEQVGRTDMGRIWYHALVDHLDSRSGFAGAARATLSAATDLFGADSPQFTAVSDAWKGVGVAARYRPKAAAT